MWFDTADNWVDAINELKVGAKLDKKYIIFYEESFYAWCKRILEEE